jgi:hypothetical protein
MVSDVTATMTQVSARNGAFSSSRAAVAQVQPS